MSMPEVVNPDSPIDPGGQERRFPHTLTEPAARNVAIGVKWPFTPRIVLPLGTARRPVVGIGGLAIAFAGDYLDVRLREKCIPEGIGLCLGRGFWFSRTACFASRGDIPTGSAARRR